jgi:hypothetical protein
MIEHTRNHLPQIHRLLMGEGAALETRIEVFDWEAAVQDAMALVMAGLTRERCLGMGIAELLLLRYVRINPSTQRAMTVSA